MIIAPDAFTTEQGHYTPDVAVDWFPDKTIGTPSPLWIGRTMHLSEDGTWDIAGTKPGTPWKPTSKAAPTIKKALDNVNLDGAEPGYFELIGPKLAGNPHGLDEVELRAHGSGTIEAADLATMPRTSLFAWPAWLERTGLQGVLWTDATGDETRYAAIRRRHFPGLD